MGDLFRTTHFSQGSYSHKGQLSIWMVTIFKQKNVWIMIAASSIAFSTSDRLSSSIMDVARAETECLSPTTDDPK